MHYRRLAPHCDPMQTGPLLPWVTARPPYGRRTRPRAHKLPPEGGGTNLDVLDWGVPVVEWLQQFSPSLDGVARAVSALGTNEVLVPAMLLVYWLLDPPAGRRTLLLFFASVAANVLLKDLFDRPRPSTIHPSIEALSAADPPAFPSGHVQNVVVVGGGLAISTDRRRWLWLVAVGGLFVGASRMYLGVHLPPEVLGGALVGVALTWAATQWGGDVERAWFGAPRWLQYAAPSALAGGALWWRWDSGGAMAAGMLFGLSIGFVVEHHYVQMAVTGSRRQRAGRAILGLGVMAAALYGFQALFHGLMPVLAWRFVRYALVGVLAAGGLPWVFVRSGLASRRTGAGVPQ